MHDTQNMTASMPRRAPRSARRTISTTDTAFTIIELLVAVAVLVVIILATARIFGTASTVASVGEANANLQQTAGAIERVIRQDVNRMTSSGYLAIECVAVRNDVNNSSTWAQAAQFGGSAIAPLLDPTRPADAIIRCDRVVFFTDGFEQTSRYVGSALMGGGLFGGNQQALAGRITIGHAVQMPTLRPTNLNQRPDPLVLDFGSAYTPLLPWSFDSPPAPNLETSLWNVAGNNAGPTVFGSQPDSRRWILSRQATLLGDDGGSKNYFNTDNSFGPNSASALWRNTSAPAAAGDNAPFSGYAPTASLVPDPWLVGGRIDIAGSNLDDVQRVVRNGANGTQLPWLTNGNDGQWLRIRNMTFGPTVSGNGGASLGGLAGWPRAEKVAPSMSRLDEILSATVLAGNCSSLEIDWTWADGTSRVSGPGNALLTALNSPTTRIALPGVNFDPGAGQVWFGLPDGVMPAAQRRGITSLAGPSGTDLPNTVNNGVTLIGTNVFNVGANQWQPYDNAVRVGPPVIPANIEGLQGVTRPLGANMPVWVYTAIFGFNHTEPTISTLGGLPALRDDYTPWPRAIRFTMRLHDPRLTLEGGRTFQFVVDLPPQTQE